MSFVLYFSGGTMRGSWGAGVATYLQFTELWKKADALYGSSAGGIICTYLRTEQTLMGSSIFPEDLAQNFISVRDFWRGVVDRLIKRGLLRNKTASVRDAINLDHLFEVMRGNKRLATERIRDHTVPLWIKVFNLSTRQVEYLNIEDHDPLTLLRASASVVPYVSTPVTIGAHRYVDAAVIEPIGYDELRRLHPDDKIVFICSLNVHIGPSAHAKNIIEGLFAHLEYGKPFFGLFAHSSRHLARDLEKIRNDPLALLVAVPKDSGVTTRTRNPQQLRALHKAGMEAGSAIEEFLEK